MSNQDYISSASGLQYKDVTEGTGTQAKAGSTVDVNYKGWLDDGSVFDESARHGRSFQFELGLGRVIKGWDEGVQGMKVGGVRELVIPASLGYGNRDLGVFLRTPLSTSKWSCLM